jgi:lysozyme
MGRMEKGGALAAAVMALVAGFEGLRTYAYRDPVGIPTICFGETRGVKMGDRATKAECQALLKVRLLEFEAGVRSCLKAPDRIPDGAYAAVLSFSYNVGVGAFCGSTMRRYLDAGQVRQACDELPRWVKARGITLPGLVNRRAAERKVCLTGLA